MVGFFFFVMIVVLGTLGLIAGLRMLGVVGSEAPRVEPGASPRELERMQEAVLALERRLDELQEQQQFLERLLERRTRSEALPPGAREAQPPDDAGPDSILFDTREDG